MLLQAIRDIQSKLPFLLDLTTADRRNLSKLGDQSPSFMDHGLVLATQKNGIWPKKFDLEYCQEVIRII